MSRATTSISELPEADEVKSGDYFIVDSIGIAKKINFNNIIFGLDNVTFASTISAHTTEINTLSSDLGTLSAQEATDYAASLAYTRTFVQSATAQFLNMVYPIGSVLYTTNNVNPSTRIAGSTWVQISQGLFIAGVGTGNDKNGTGFTVAERNNGVNYNTGEYNHVLATSELPAHTHDFNIRLNNTGGTSSYQNGPQASPAMRLDNNTTYTTQQNTGGGSGHNNIPPLYGLYVWERTA